jgi:hypothetical protein
VGDPEENRSLGGLKYEQDRNNKVDLIEIGWNDMDWIDLAQDWNQWKVLVNTVMKLRIPQNFEKFWSS